MRKLRLKAIVAVNNEGNYVIHGSDEETPAEMFKAIAGGENPIWHFDPSTEQVHYVEVEVSLPELETVNAIVTE